MLPSKRGGRPRIANLRAMVDAIVYVDALVYDAARRELVSKGAGLAFQIHDGIPVMLIDEARKLDP